MLLSLHSVVCIHWIAYTHSHECSSTGQTAPGVSLLQPRKRSSTISSYVTDTPDAEVVKSSPTAILNGAVTSPPTATLKGVFTVHRYSQLHSSIAIAAIFVLLCGVTACVCNSMQPPTVTSESQEHRPTAHNRLAGVVAFNRLHHRLQDAKEFPWLKQLGKVLFDCGPLRYAIISEDAPVHDVFDHVFVRASPGFGITSAPSLVISVVGGAGGLSEDSWDTECFCSSLVSVGLRTDAWFVTGGTKSGVMDLVGRALRKHDKFRRICCLGFTSYGALAPRWRKELLSDGLGKPYLCVAKTNRDTWKEQESQLTEPQDDHTHSIFCYSGKEDADAFGDEIKFRTEFELYMAQHHDASRVMILVNGGIFSMLTLDAAVQRSCPIVVCKGSGRCADVIASFIESVQNQSPGRQKRRSNSVSDLDPNALGEEVIQAALEDAMANLSEKDRNTVNADHKQALIRIVESNMVWVYSRNSEMRLEDIILQAIFETSVVEKDLHAQLTLAVQWRCSSNYDRILTRLLDENPNEAIGWIFKHFIQKDTEDNGKHSQQQGVTLLIQELVERNRGHIQNFNTANLANISFGFQGILKLPDGYEGLILWSIDNLATTHVLEAIWMQMDDPLHAALVVAGACRAKANTDYASYKDLMEQQRLQTLSDQFEKLAVIMLTDLLESSGNASIQYLFEDSRNWNFQEGDNNCFMMAFNFACKSFIATPAFRMALERYYLTPSPFKIEKRSLDPKCLQCWELVLLIFRPCSSNLSLHDLLSTPYIKSRTHTISRFLFTITYVGAVMGGFLIQADMHFVTMALFIWGCGYALAEIRQFMLESTARNYFSDFWNALDCIYLSVLLCSLLVGWIKADHSQNVNSLERTLVVLHSLNLLPCWLRNMQSLYFLERVGVLLISMLQMIKDTASWFVLILFVVLAFSFSLTPILHSSAGDRGVGWAFWSLFSDDDGMRDKAKELATPLQFVCNTLIYVLFVLSNVLLMNLLIAMMNNTYEMVQAESKTEWAYSHMQAVLEYGEKSPFPPPLNILYHLGSIITRPCQRTCEITDESEAASPVDRLVSGTQRVQSIFSQRELHDAQARAMSALRAEEEEGDEEVDSLRAENNRLLDRIRTLEQGLADTYLKSVGLQT